MGPHADTPTVDKSAFALRLMALTLALSFAQPTEASLLPCPVPPQAEQPWASVCAPPGHPFVRPVGDRSGRGLQIGSTDPLLLDDGHVLQEADGASAGHAGFRRYHYGYGPLAVTDTNGKRFIQTDALGSPTDLTSTAGAIASIRKYDAWGSYRDATAPSTGDEKLGYTGHQYDPETGLVYARARYYDPEVGAFISRDGFEGWLEDAPSLHRYAYAHGNPLAFVDPDGNAAADAADAWEKKQEEVAWTAEQVMAQAGGNSEEIGREAADEFYRNHGNSESMRFLVGLKVTFVQTVHEVSGAISGTIVDPTILVRAPLRIGTGTAAGWEKVQEGKYAEGALMITADASGALATAGGMWGATAPIRAAVSGPTISLPGRASRAAAAEGEAVVGRGGAATVARTAEAEVGAPKARPVAQEVPAASRQPELSAAQSNMLDAAILDRQATSPAIRARLAEQMRSDPRAVVGMERTAARSTLDPTSGNGLSNAQHAAELSRNMGLEGRAPVVGEAAGHIVPSSGKTGHWVAGARSRGLLERYGIGVDDAANGVPVGHPRPHNTMHTRAFLQSVESRLSAVEQSMAKQGYGHKAIRSALRRNLRKIGREVVPEE